MADKNLIVNAQEIEDSVSKKHTHTNKSVLDGITQTKIDEWDNKAPLSHRHDASDIDNLPSGGGTGLTPEQATNVAKIPEIESSLDNIETRVENLELGGGGGITFRDVVDGEIFEISTEPSATVNVTGVALNKSTTTINMGTTEQLTATVSPTNASNKTLTWTSSNTNVATVSSTGLVTGVASGSATVIVSTVDGSYTATCNINVQTSVIAVTGISLNKTTSTLTIGNTEQLTANITPSNATNKNVTWTSNDTNVATVSSTGLVTAITSGNVTISATSSDGGFDSSCSYTIIQQSIIEEVVTVDEYGYMTLPLYNAVYPSFANYTQATNNGYTTKRASTTNPLFDFTDTEYTCDKLPSIQFSNIISTLSEGVSVTNDTYGIYVKLTDFNAGADITTFLNYIQQLKANLRIKLKSGVNTLNITSNISNFETRTTSVDTNNFEYVKFTPNDGIGGMTSFTSKHIISNGLAAQTGYSYSSAYENLKIDIANNKVEMLLKKGTLSSVTETGLKEYLTNANIKVYWI